MKYAPVIPVVNAASEPGSSSGADTAGTPAKAGEQITSDNNTNTNDNI
jgi:hypothetical protein